MSYVFKKDYNPFMLYIQAQQEVLKIFLKFRLFCWELDPYAHYVINLEL